MELGKVVGTVVCTQKSSKLDGHKLLVVEAVSVDGVPKKTFTVALDNVGAGLGETVLMVKGSSARQAKGMETTPTDATIVGIVDTVEMGGKETFRKY